MLSYSCILICLLVITKINANIQCKCVKTSVSCGCGVNNVMIKSKQDHYNFEKSIPSSWPMIVSLNFDCNHNNNSTQHCCTGTILTESLILSSSRCVENITRFDLLSGSVTVVAENQNGFETNEIIRRVDRIDIHPSKLNSNNIALLHLEEPFDFSLNDRLSSTCIESNVESFEKNQRDSTSDSSFFIVVRWHQANIDQRLSSSFIEQKQIHLVEHDDEDCKSIIENPTKQFCILTNEFDQDLDLPVFQWIHNRWLQIGIVMTNPNGLKKNNRLSIVTRLGHYQNWFQSIQQQFLFNNKKQLDRSKLQVPFNQLYPTHYRCFGRKTQCGCGLEEVRLTSGEISSGEEAIATSWSMIVSIRVNQSRQHICAGSVLTNFHILTAAHCVDRFPQTRLDDLTVLGGIHGLFEGGVDILEVDRITIHPNWNSSSNNYLNDLAILRLRTSLDMENNPFVKPSCIPYNVSQDIIRRYPNTNASLAVIGWGSMRAYPNITENLQQSEVFVVDSHHSSCNLSTDRQKLQFCAGLNNGIRDACAGDSGGPIFEWKGKSWEQVGVTSYRRSCKNNTGSGLYTRLANYYDWLRDVTGESFTTTTVTPVTNPPVTYFCNASLTCGCGYNDVQLSPSSRIINGFDAIPNSWSMIVSLRRLSNNNHFCGGSILNDYFILTAAHCVMKNPTETPTGIFAAAGSHRQSDLTQTPNEIDRIFIHPEWVPGRLGNWNDIALLRLSRPLNISTNRNITRTCLQRANRSTNMAKYPQNGTRLVAIGWGVVDEYYTYLPNDLQQVEIFAFDKENEPCESNIKDKARQFCAGIPITADRDTCRGDSGSPVFEWKSDRWEQIGLVSYGLICANSRSPTVYTQVTNYIEWIEQVMKEWTPSTLETSRSNFRLKHTWFITTIIPIVLFILA